MPYVSLDNLARFHGRLRDRASSEFASLGMANWQKTAAAGAVSFSPVPEMPLDPVVNFLFTETGPASGTKSPDNPSTITGVTQAKVTRCGKNLLQTDNLIQVPDVGLSITVNDDGTISVSGSTPSNSGSHLYFFNPTQNTSFGLPNFFALGKTYTSSFSCNDINIQFAIYFHNGTSWSSPYYDNCTFTVPTNAVSCMIRLSFPSETTFNGIVKIQIEEDSTATSFEPYDGAEYTIDLGGTYYGGSVDLSTGVMMVTHFCTNVSTFYQFTEAKTDCILVRFRCDYYSKESSDLVSYVCDLFPSSRDTSDFEHVRQNNDSAISATLYLAKSRLDLSGAADSSNPTDAEWLAAANAWVAEHPFDFVSMLKNPYTVQLTPTQIYSLSQIDPYNPRINTVYSDQTSVEVGYPKSPQATQNELTNAVVSLGGNL